MRGAVALFVAGLLLLGAAVVRARGEGVERVAPPPADRDGAVEAVRMLISLAQHYEGAGGDERFLERLPAAPQVVDEIRRDREFALHLGVAEEGKDARVDVSDVRRAGEGQLEVDVTEYRVTQRSGSQGAESRSDVVRTRYVVVRQPGGWTVVDRRHAPLMLPAAGGG